MRGRSRRGIRYRLLLDQLLKRVVFPAQGRRTIGGLEAGSFQLLCAVPQSQPQLRLLDERHCAARRAGLRRLGSLVLRGFMLLQRLFDLGVRVASLPNQILLRVFEFVLVQRQLRLS